jgi:pimeloyl-ACP methyl ester carboxylesterase
MTDVTTGIIDTAESRMRIGGMEGVASNVWLAALPVARISSGPIALFVHGVVLNKHLWRHQLAKLSDIRHCIAVDLLAHGDTEIAPNQDVSVTTNANMLKEVLDALKIDRVDLIGNDSGGGIAQIFAALPGEVGTLAR